MNEQERNKFSIAVGSLLDRKGYHIDYSTGKGVVLMDKEAQSYGRTAPSYAEIDAEIARLEALEYREKRAAEYPSAGDQLGALMKGGQELLDMQEKIQAVKNKYPKGS